jgi:hypothetical protein
VKSKAPQLYTHQPAIAQELGISEDGRRVCARVTVLGSSSAAQPTYTADTAAEAALDSLDGSYMLGDDGFPLDNENEADQAGVKVVPARNKNSVGLVWLWGHVLTIYIGHTAAYLASIQV